MARVPLLLAALLLLAVAAWPAEAAHRDPTPTRTATRTPTRSATPVPTAPAGRVGAGRFTARLPVVGDEPRPTATTTPSPTPRPTVSTARQFGYGASVASLGGNGGKLREMGFTHAKVYLSWATSEPSKGRYQWLSAPGANDANNIANDAARHGVKLIVRVDTPPAWAAPGSGNRPPSNPQDYGDFMGALAAYLKGRVVAYELWNEPNLSYEWGNQRPDPAQYTRLLQAAYPRIKAADPDALVISAGMATTGGDGGATATNDVEFIRGMYAAGARGYFDVLGSHPYGFANSPDTRNPNGVTDFQRAADQYQVMQENGDGDKAVWATELGWLLDPAHYGQGSLVNDPLWNGRQWQRVDPATQAAYLVQAYDYAYRNWPWMGVMLLFNLDFSTVPWYPAAEPMRWYAVLNQDGSGRAAFEALRGMAKPLR